MSDQTVPPELLDLDLSSIDTSFPVVAGGLYDLVVKESDVIRNKNDNGWLWVVKLNPVNDVKDIRGQPLKAASATLFHRVSLTPTDNYDAASVAKNTARFIQAMKPTVTGITSRDLFPDAEGFKVKCKAFVGRMLQAKVDALPDRKDKNTGRTLPPGNEISQFVKA